MGKKPVSDTTEKKLSNLKPFKAGPEWTETPLAVPSLEPNKLTEDFLSAVAEDFEKHGKAVLKTVREEDPSTYLRVVAQIIPKEAELNIKGDDAFVALWQKVSSGALADLIDKMERDEARH